MSNDDYKVGQQGLRYDRSMNKADYDRGKADREDQAAQTAGSRTEVPGGGIGLIFMSPILAIMYPLVTLTIGISGGVLWLLTEHLPPRFDTPRLIVSIAVLLVAFWFSFKVERVASESKIYRHIRNVFRVVVIGLATFEFMLGWRPGQVFQTSMDHAPPSSLFAALVAAGLMLWLGPGLDRFFFPVRDARAIKQEAKFAGKTSVEIDEIKHAETRSRLKFFGVWLAGTIGLIFALPQAPVALDALGWFVLCWLGKKMLA
jgi:hypothetical protein